MKKEAIVLFLVVMLLVSPLILAQEQTPVQTEQQIQTYSGFSRFVDNVKLFFSAGDNKVQLALEIKEKEVNSAIANVKTGEDEKADESLKNAWKKLQMIQERVSVNTAEQVRQSSNEVIENIVEEDLPNDFDVYVLEEEKTGLTAEWVVEVNGPEGQTLTREVEVVMGENGEQNRVVEIENRIDEIDNEISNWVVENSVEEDKDNGLTWEVKTEVANGDNGLKPEVKKSVTVDKASMTKDNEDVTPSKNNVDGGVDPGPQGIVGQSDSDSGTTNNVVEGDGGEGDYAEGTTAEGSDAGDTSSDSGGEDGSSDSGGDDGGDSAPVTGEAIKNSNSNSIIKKIFGWLF